MLSKNELTKGRAAPLISGREFSMLFKTWSCVARSPPEADESVENADPDEPAMVCLFIYKYIIHLYYHVALAC